MASAYILGIVISKLSHWQKFDLIVLFKIDKDSKVSLYSAILPFCLAIGLEMKDNRKLLLDFKEITEQ